MFLSQCVVCVDSVFNQIFAVVIYETKIYKMFSFYICSLVSHFVVNQHGLTIFPAQAQFHHLAQGVNFKKLGHFINNNILKNKQKWFSLLEFKPCNEP